MFHFSLPLSAAFYAAPQENSAQADSLADHGDRRCAAAPISRRKVQYRLNFPTALFCRVLCGTELPFCLWKTLSSCFIYGPFSVHFVFRCCIGLNPCCKKKQSLQTAFIRSQFILCMTPETFFVASGHKNTPGQIQYALNCPGAASPLFHIYTVAEAEPGFRPFPAAGSGPSFPAYTSR